MRNKIRENWNKQYSNICILYKNYEDKEISLETFTDFVIVQLQNITELANKVSDTTDKYLLFVVKQINHTLDFVKVELANGNIDDTFDKICFLNHLCSFSECNFGQPKRISILDYAHLIA